LKLAFVACLPVGLMLAVPIAASAQGNELAVSAHSEASTGSQAGELTGRQIREQSRAMIREMQERRQADAIARASRPAPTAQSVNGQRIAGMEITPGSDEADATMSIIQSRNAQEAYAAEQASTPGWLERVHAAIVEYWVACKFLRSRDAEADRPDPAWAKKFSENLFDLTSMAQDEDEWAMLTSEQAQANETGYKQARQKLIEKRKRIATIYADDNGKFFALAAIIFDPIKIIILFIIALLLKNPYRKIRMGVHLARMTSILESVERTRNTMPIGAGGGIDSLPKNRQMAASSTIERGISYLKKFEKLDVTDALIKNMQTAQRRSLQTRYACMAKLLELLVKEGVAMDLRAWVKIRNMDIPNMILD